MPQTLDISAFTIKIGGRKIDMAMEEDIVEIVVDTNLHLPDMCAMQLYDHDLRWVDNTGLLALGKEIEISVAHERRTVVLFKGEITGLESDFSAEEPAILLVRGYDKSHRLHRGRKTKSYLNVKDSDLVQQLAGNAGLQSDIEVTNTVYPYLLQHNQTDMEFLQQRAQRIGYLVYAVEGKLCWKKYPLGVSAGAAPRLGWGEDLRGFRPRVTGTHQADKVTVKGWNPAKKEAIIGQATAPTSTANQGGITDGGGAATKKAFGGAAEWIVVDNPVIDRSEAESVAKGILDAVSGSFVQAEGECLGNPLIKAGSVVEIAGVGQRFSGKYFVTAATHVFSVHTGYDTTFHIAGQDPNTLLSLIEPRSNSHGSGFPQGVVPGIVTNLDDPDGLGRVKIKFPWLSDQDESHWARLAAPMAGAQRGMMILPEVNDEVLVAFEHGDINQPYVMGALWNATDKPPLAKADVIADGKVKQRIWKSRVGHTILLDDTDNKGQIVIRDSTGKDEIVIDADKKTITIQVDQDYTLKAGNKIDVTGKQKITIKSESSDVTVEGTNITIDGRGNLAVKAKGNLDLQATGQLNIKGTQVSINANAAAEIKSSGMVQIQGSLVKIN